MTFTFIGLAFECAKLGKAGIYQRFREVLTLVFEGQSNLMSHTGHKSLWDSL